MKPSQKFAIKGIVNSFRYAFAGIFSLISGERNAKIHAVAAVLVIIMGLCLKISSIQWCIILFCIGGVFCAEAFNSAIETLCDRVSPENNPLIKKTKDMAAGAVLLLVIAAVIIGLIIFIPPLVRLFT
jgi:diacylglycerol kinase (ATP)